MITFEEAHQIALKNMGTGCGLLEERTLEKPYGWYFCSQSLECIESGDPMKMLVGSGGFIVEKADGRIFEFGSMPLPETWIQNYERGFKYHRYNLVITAVSCREKAAEILEQLKMCFVIPEEEGGTVWRIQTPYSKKMLFEMLGRLSCLFQSQTLNRSVPVFDLLDATDCCSYKISPADGQESVRV